MAPLVRLVLDVPLPRRTALVPEVVDDDPDPRDVDEEPLVDEPLDEDEPELLEPDELEPDDPLDGGAERTGCCSEYDGAEYAGAE